MDSSSVLKKGLKRMAGSDTNTLHSEEKLDAAIETVMQCLKEHKLQLENDIGTLKNEIEKLNNRLETIKIALLDD